MERTHEADLRKECALESGLGRLLQAGVTAAGAVMLTGGLLFLLRHGGEFPDYRHFHAPRPGLRSPAAIWTGIRDLHATALIQLGVLLMVATPVLRVAFALGSFALSRDRLYTAISLIVLALLAVSFRGAF